MDENKSIIVLHEKQFDEVISIIQLHQSKASRMVNEELLQTAWYVGSYVSAKLKSEEWGSKVVSQLSEYIRARRPDIAEETSTIWFSILKSIPRLNLA